MTQFDGLLFRSCSLSDASISDSDSYISQTRLGWRPSITEKQRIVKMDTDEQEADIIISLIGLPPPPLPPSPPDDDQHQERTNEAYLKLESLGITVSKGSSDLDNTIL